MCSIVSSIFFIPALSRALRSFALNISMRSSGSAIRRSCQSLPILSRSPNFLSRIKLYVASRVSISACKKVSMSFEGRVSLFASTSSRALFIVSSESVREECERAADSILCASSNIAMISFSPLSIHPSTLVRISSSRK